MAGPQHTAKNMLVAGTVAAAIFTVVVTVEAFARPGFDLRRHAASMLALGERGWVMTTVFLLTGALTMTCAVGMRRLLAGTRGGTWGPLLVGTYGLGLFAAGIFPAPAALGFPKGTPADLEPVMTTTAMLHGVAFALGFSSLTACCFVLSRRSSWGGARWSAFSTVAGVLLPVLVIGGMMQSIPTGIAFYLAALLGWLWLVVIVHRLRSAETLARETVAGEVGQYA